MNEDLRLQSLLNETYRSNELLEIRNLTKRYGKKNTAVTALDDINLTVHQGDYISVLGESGSGKSTLLYQIGCLDYPSSGSILYNGRDLTKLDDKARVEIRRRDIGIIFQFFNLVPNLNVMDNVLFPAVLNGDDVSLYKDKAERALELVGLTDRRRRLPRELTGAQQQRAAIARSVIMSPQILLADEPTGNLDSAASREIMELFTRLNQEERITVLQVTHSAEMAAYGRVILHMSDGRLTEGLSV